MRRERLANMYSWSIILVSILWLSGCGADSKDTSSQAPPSPTRPTADVTPASPVRITVSGLGHSMIFDPSFERDALTRQLWMSFSTSTPATPLRQGEAVHTQVAHSDDDGRTWALDGLVNESVDTAFPVVGAWDYETSRLFEDPFVPPNTNGRWNLIFHRFIKVGSEPHFDHGWIGLRTAPSPQPGNWSTEKKLIVVTAYNRANDSILGIAEVSVSNLHSDLANCQVVGEPGALAQADGWYISIDCANANARLGRIVLLRRLRSTGAWAYLGTLLDNSDA